MSFNLNCLRRLPALLLAAVLGFSLSGSAAFAGTANEVSEEEGAASESDSDTAADPAAGEEETAASEDVQEVVLRVCNWEEYIDLGDWDEEETIDLESGDIIGINSMIDDFEEWYYETYGIKVTVEYSTFGTNEDLYNMLTLGDVYDLVCPSEYMFMKLMAEDALVPLSEEFFDTSNEYNYYINGLSPYIKEIFETQEIGGESWSTYAAGYMWGVTGIVYNPEVVSAEDASSWNILTNTDYDRQVTIKDNVRDSYFAAVGAIKSDLLTSEEFLSDPDYKQNLEDEMNDTSEETIAAVEEWLKTVKENAYSFETDSGKSDMVAGRVVANYQWSGDAVYSLDLAEEDDYILAFAVPEESTNIYFDGWVMLKSGVEGDAAKQHAAEAFINFLSRPDNVVRNMYYIGYTSVISGGDDTTIFEYAEWCYAAEEDEEDTAEYPLGYFFTGDDTDEDYILTTTSDQLYRQLFAQYPSQEVIARSSIMVYFDSETNQAINEMWIHVRCFEIGDIPTGVWVLAAAVACVLIGFGIRSVRKKRKVKS